MYTSLNHAAAETRRHDLLAEARNERLVRSARTAAHSTPVRVRRLRLPSWRGLARLRVGHGMGAESV
jgi:hypothetical protein